MLIWKHVMEFNYKIVSVAPLAACEASVIS